MEKDQFIDRGFYYSGTVVEILDTVLYQIKVDIPGIIQDVMAFPIRGEVDEPKVGDFVMLKCFDPIYQSYYLYHKIKENDFIGFRSNGKMVDITPDYITVGIFPNDLEYNDIKPGYRPKVTDWIKIDKDGNLDVKMRKDAVVNIEGDCTINVNGKTKLTCPDVTITGGKFTMKGTSSTDNQGPFNCIPVCPFSGAPHRGAIVSGT